jgi:hypothetical protein
MSFDISRHPEAQSVVAKSMIDRLRSDLKLYADSENHVLSVKFKPIVESALQALEQPREHFESSTKRTCFFFFLPLDRNPNYLQQCGGARFKSRIYTSI